MFLDDLIKTQIGSPILYDLIYTCQEFLTENNHPTCPCSICLYHIVQGDSFVKTPCYHYFHSACFGRFLSIFQPISENYEDDFSDMAVRKKAQEADVNVLPCPVCRDEFKKDEWNVSSLLREKDGTLLAKADEKLVKTQSLEDFQKAMQKLQENQIENHLDHS